MLRSDRATALALAALAMVVYLRSGPEEPTHYDYFSRLALAFASGRPWLDEAPSWLNELVPCAGDHWCVHLAPLPALWVLPFLGLWSSGAAQAVASVVAAALSAIPAYLAMRRLGAPRSVAVATVIFAIFGTTLWFTSSDGRAWYVSHSVAVLAGSLAVLAAVDGRSPLLVGALLGATGLARYPMALAAPGLALLVARRRNEPLGRVVLLGMAGLLPFGAALLLYDQARFGSPLETGYVQLTVGDPFFDHGLFSLEYVPRHLYAILMQAPEYVDAWPLFLRPNWIGVSLALTSPAFAFVVPALLGRARAETLPLALAALGPLALDAIHGTIGFAQFGYRYSLDLQPFLLPLVALGACWRGAWAPPGWPYLATITWSVVANLYGVLAISKLEYVSGGL